MRAHALAPALLEIRDVGDGMIDVRWKLAAMQPRAVHIEPQLPSGCRPLAQPIAEMDGEGVVQRFRARCEGSTSLVGKSAGLMGLHGSDTNTLLRVSLSDGRVVRALLSAESPMYTIPARRSAARVAADYAGLGVHHLLTGADHVLFVLGLLLLVRGVRPLVTTVTAFTLGHSITLALAVLGVLVVPQAPAELAIAASILVLAAEIVARERGTPSLLSRKPWLMSCAFGLLHGVGFGGALVSVGVPRDEIALALGSFNCGIEVAQLAIIAVALGAARAARSLTVRALPWATQLPAYCIGSAAALWCFERLEPVLRTLGA